MRNEEFCCQLSPTDFNPPPPPNGGPPPISGEAINGDFFEIYKASF